MMSFRIGGGDRVGEEGELKDQPRLINKLKFQIPKKSVMFEAVKNPLEDG